MTRRVTNLMPSIVSLENLHESFLRAVRGKAAKMAVAHMRRDLDQHLRLMSQQLMDGTFRFGVYNFFDIVDQKRRTICAASFPERVAFQAMMRICHPVFEGFQTNDSFASRPGRGTYKALERAQQKAGRYRYFAKLDVVKFFYSISHEVMMAQLCRLFKDPTLLMHFQNIIGSYEASPGRGLPIGNLTSQYFANHYLAVADHWAKEQLHVAAMIRYMDDTLLFANDLRVLRQQVNEYINYVEQNLKLTMHQPIINGTEFGIPFLGYVVYKDGLRLTQRSRHRFKIKMKRLAADLDAGRISQEEYTMRAQCLTSYVAKADTMGFRHHLEDTIEGIYPQGL